MNPLTYSDKFPQTPGWYWRREHGKASIVEVTRQTRLPNHWRARRASLLRALETLKTDQTAIDHAAALPASHWLIEWAGPIPHPV